MRDKSMFERIQDREETIECSECGHTMFRTIYGWYKCRNEYCFNVQSSGGKTNDK